MKFSVLAVLLLPFIWVEVESAFLPTSVENHYWREYTGWVSTYAIPGARNKRGDVMYIGQFSIARNAGSTLEIDTIPAIIIEGSRIAQCAYGGYIRNSTDDSNLKIIEAINVSSYVWRNPKEQIFPNCKFVVGGSEKGIPLYIGAINLDGAVTIGKVFAHSRPFALIAPADNGKEGVYAEDFLVLTFCS